MDVHTGDENGPGAPLKLACQEDHVDVVRELLALGGDRSFSPAALERCALKG